MQDVDDVVDSIEGDQQIDIQIEQVMHEYGEFLIGYSRDDCRVDVLHAMAVVLRELGNLGDDRRVVVGTLKCDRASHDRDSLDTRFLPPQLR